MVVGNLEIENLLVFADWQRPMELDYVNVVV
jgi:hypothetical protein